MTRCSLLRLLAAGACAVAATHVTVVTPLGTVVGTDEGDYIVFRGIPYAEPPKRFGHAADKAPWNGTLDATHFRDACAGARAREGLFSTSEDCLHLNVWRPLSANKLPVMVFIHGGGFLSGSGSDPQYWGDLVVQDFTTPVLYVTFNYRLSILGFFSHEDTGANFGLADQQAALRWIQKNIEAFGGDPSAVTIMGQSAGAMSVETHLVAPASQGLFHRAFVSSTVGLHYRNTSENAPFVRSVALTVGCYSILTGAIDVDCMRSRSATVLVDAADATGYLFHLTTPCQDCDNFLPWLPVVDGDTLPGRPLDLIVQGRHAKVPVVLSTVGNESEFFLPGVLKEVVDIKLAYSLVLGVVFKDNQAKVQEHYANSPDSAGMDDFHRLALAVTDSLFTCYARYLAKQLSKQGTHVTLQTFMHAPSTSTAFPAECHEGATCHAADIPFMFPAGDAVQMIEGFSYTTEEGFLCAGYSNAVRRFAHGFPGTWSAYDESTDKSLQWYGPVNGVVQHYDAAHCDFLESIGYPQIWDAPALPPAGSRSSESVVDIVV